MSIKGHGHISSSSERQPNSSNFTSSLTNNPKDNHAKSLYIEIVLDICGGKASIESLEKFKTILDWLLGGMISEEEFDMLFLQWTKQSALTITDLRENIASSPQKRNNIIESEWNKFFMENYTDYQLDVLMGMLINFQNKDLKFQWQCTDDWLRSVEHLFFLLDDENKSVLSLEEILVLVIVIASDYARNGQSITPEFVLNQAFEVMNDAGAYKGAITLRRFKQYFNNNSLDKKAIESSVSLLSESPSVNNLLSNSILVNFESEESPFVIPKLWREAVLDTKKLYSNSAYYDHLTDDVMAFLLKEALVHKQSLKNTSLGFEGALHLFFAFSKKTLVEKQYSTDDIKKEPLFEIFEKSLSKFHSLIKQTVNTYAHKEGGTIDSSTMTNTEEDDSLVREQLTIMMESPCITDEVTTEEKTPEKIVEIIELASTNQFQMPIHESTLELSPPPIEDMQPIIEACKPQEEAKSEMDLVVTPTKGLHKKELEKIGALNIKLPFDIDRMLRNAEWIDIKPSNLMNFPYLPKTGKGPYIENFLRNEARRSIYTESTQDSGDKANDKIIEERILETEEMLSTNYTIQDIRKPTSTYEENKLTREVTEEKKEEPMYNVATPIKSSTEVDLKEDMFTEKEIEEEVEKFFTLNNIPNYHNDEGTSAITQPQDSEEETLMFHKLLKKQRAESSKNLNYNMGSPELDKKDLSTPNRKPSPELLSQPKEYEPDIIFINEDDSFFISPTIPKRLEKAFKGSSVPSPRPSPRVVAFAPQQSQFVATPKVLNNKNPLKKSNKPYQPILTNPSIPKRPESPRQSLNTILTTALRDTSAILKETEVNNYSPSKTISVKLSDFIDDKSKKANSTSKSSNSIKKTNNTSVGNNRAPSKITQKPRVVEDTLINDKRPKLSERKK